MFLVGPPENNRWIYTMHGLEKPMDHLSAGGVMAGSVATLAILWVSLQTMGLLGHSHSIGAYKLPVTLQNYLAGYTGLPTSDTAPAGIVDTGYFQNRRFPRIDEKTINNSITFAQSLMDRMTTLERNIDNAGVGINNNSSSENQYLTSYTSEDAFEKGLQAILALKATSYLTHQNCRRYGLSKDDCARFISTVKLQGTALGTECEDMQHVNCNARTKYRTIDGSCNNVQNPNWGRAMTAYSRILFPQYFDGIQEPRRLGQTKRTLPGARTVSSSLSVPTDQTDVSRTLAVVQWSQFISHDLSHTPVRKMVSSGKPISCCRADGGMLPPRYLHPDCSAINVPDGDPVYGEHYVRCMNYVRSLPVLTAECTLGPAEQMNQVSHFLDASTIYGSNTAKARELRSFEGGRLHVEVRDSRDFLPASDATQGAPCKDSCYNAGDFRANIDPQMAAIHTVWHREHNRVADQLARLNSNWSDEVLYQEARRIVIAEIQHITYKEWLPILLGRRYSRAVGLNTGSSYTRNYNSDDEPAVSNEAATAALRFYNSLMQERLSMPDEARMMNRTLQLAEHFYNPRIIESEDMLDSLVRGLATQTSQKMDISLVADLTSKMYKTNADGLGLDAVSLDIQRGRDHGLPGYNYYRRHCGFTSARTFDDFLDFIPMDVVKKLRTLYQHPNDVDLVVGGMAERPAEDGILGPTFRCLVHEQFARTRRTDRFFYDSVAQPHPFTPEQLAAIRNVTLARIFCDNGDNITRMQPNVFMKPQVGNDLMSCANFEAIPSVDLFAWAERAKAYR